MTEREIIDVLAMMGSYKFKIGSKNVYASCPLAKWRHPKGTDNNPSFSVLIAPNDVSVCHCFSCGFRGTFYALAREFEKYAGGGKISRIVASKDRISYKKRFDFSAYEEAKRFYYKSVTDVRKTISGDILSNVKELNFGDFERFIKQVPKYFLKRGFDRGIAKEWKIGYFNPGKDEVKNGLYLGKYNFVKGVFFPIFDCKQRFVGYTIRRIDDKEPKYIHCREPFKRNYFLFGEHKISSDRGAIIIVEGAFDVLRVWSAGFNCVGLLGSSISEIQADKIVDLNPSNVVIIMGDGDEAGLKAQEQWEAVLKRRVKVVKISLPFGKDPADLNEEVISKYVATRI